MLRVAHYLNQFFAGVGGEDKAGYPFEVREGAVGPGRALQVLFGDQATITHTLVCGDNAFHEILTPTSPQSWTRSNRSGPICWLLGRDSTPAVMAWPAGPSAPRSPSARNPGDHRCSRGSAVDVYRSRTVMVPTGNSAAGMQEAIFTIARVGLRIARGEPCSRR
jgi:glycine reductase